MNASPRSRCRWWGRLEVRQLQIGPKSPSWFCVCAFTPTQTHLRGFILRLARASLCVPSMNIPGSSQQGVWGSSDHPKPGFPWSLPSKQRIPPPARRRCCYSWLPGSPRQGFFWQVRSLLAGCFAPGVHTSTWAVCLCQIRGAAWCWCFYLSGEAADEQSVGGTSRAGLGRAGGRPGCFSWVRLAAGMPGSGEGLG